MWKHSAKLISPKLFRSFATSRQSNHKVCVVGGAGGIGQPLSLLLKINPLVSDLCLYDLKATPGIAMDLSHIDTGVHVSGLCGPDNLKNALNCSQVVILVAGIPRKPGQERSDLFKSNATMVVEVVQVFAKYCPKALLLIVTNPLNSLVPLAAEVLKKAGVFDPKRLFGVTSLDVVRARTFVGEYASIDPKTVEIPVIAGHSNLTILPIFSQLKPKQRDMDQEYIEKLVNKIQEAGAAVVAAKGTGSATLSIAYATERFANSLMMGLNGDGKTPIECSYVFSNVTECEFFSTPLRLGKEGISENLGLPGMNELETEMLKCLIPILKKDIEMGKEFAKNLK